MKDLKKILKTEKIISEKNGVFYFSVVPGNIRPSTDQSPEDQTGWSHWRKENFNYFKVNLAKKDNAIVLADIGAGQSDFKKIVSSFNLISVDFYPYEGINVVCDFAAGLPFQDDSLDIILLSNVIEHIPEPENFLNECGRALKKGGMLLGSVPFVIGVHQRPYDFYRYTDIYLDRIFDKCGFIEPEIKPVTGEHIIIFSLLGRLFTNLARNTKFSSNRILNGLIVLFVRILWKLIRIGYLVLGPLFKKWRGDTDWPLGYHFKTLKA